MKIEEESRHFGQRKRIHQSENVGWNSRSLYSGVSRFMAFYPRVEKVLERWPSGNYFRL